MLLLKAILRDWIRRPWQVVFSLVGVSLGVAVVIGIDITSESARLDFERSNDLVDGVASHRIIGVASPLRAGLYTTLKVELGIQRAAPVISSQVTAAGSAQILNLVGIDPFSDYRIRNLEFSGSTDSGTPAFAIYATQTLMRELDVSVGDDLTLLVDGEPRKFSLAGELSTGGIDAGGLNHLVVVDIATAQFVLRRGDVLDYIDVVATPAEVKRIRAVLPAGISLVDLDSRNHARQNMTKAFRTNLLALSLLALLVGMFLVYNTMRFQVVRRTRLFGLMRAIGVLPNELAAWVLLEALIIGLAGSIIGFILGVFLSQALYHLMGQTINNLYYSLFVTGVSLHGMTLLKAVTVGVLVTLLAALTPALMAARVSGAGSDKKYYKPGKSRTRILAAWCCHNRSRNGTADYDNEPVTGCRFCRFVHGHHIARLVCPIMDCLGFSTYRLGV